MSGLGEQLNWLVNVRNECRKLTQDLAASERQAELFIRQNEAIVSDVARDQPRNRTKAKAESTRGPATRSRLACAEAKPSGVVEDLAIARSQAEEDIKNHQV